MPRCCRRNHGYAISSCFCTSSETANNYYPVYSVTDLARGGDWSTRVLHYWSTYYESDAANIIRSVVSGVAHLHEFGIVHRDLKPENLLFQTRGEDSRVLIVDFGISRIIDEEQFQVLTTTCGTPGFMAPEMIEKTGHGKPVDMWAIGVMTYFFLYGLNPFGREDALEEIAVILKADFDFRPVEYWNGISPAAKKFIQECIVVDPLKRLTAPKALAHDFLANCTGVETRRNRSDLLPTVKKNMGARKTFHTAIDMVRAINKLRESQGSTLEGQGGLIDDHTALAEPVASARDVTRVEGN